MNTQTTPTDTLTQQTLHMLANCTDEHWNIQTIVAYHKQTSSHTLNHLAQNPNQKTKTAALQNKSCPADTLKQNYTQTPDEHPTTITETILNNPNCPPDILTAAANSTNQKTKTATAQNKSCPPDILQKLADEKHWQTRYSVAKNPNCPPDTLAKLAKDQNQQIQNAALAHINLTENTELQTQIQKLAQNPNTPTNTLKLNALLQNPTLPAHTLTQLANNPTINNHTTLLTQFTTHPNCPADTLQKLAENPNTPHHILAEIASNPNCNKTTINILTKTSADIQKALAQNPGLTKNQLTKLHNTTNYWEVSEALAQNRSCPSDILQNLAKDPLWTIRAAVASNQSCPDYTLTTLLDDENLNVKLEAAQNPGCQPKHAGQIIATLNHTLTTDPPLKSLSHYQLNKIVDIILQITKQTQTLLTTNTTTDNNKAETLYNHALALTNSKTDHILQTPVTQNLYQHTIQQIQQQNLDKHYTTAQKLTLQKLATENGWPAPNWNKQPATQPPATTLKTTKAKTTLTIKP